MVLCYHQTLLLQHLDHQILLELVVGRVASGSVHRVDSENVARDILVCFEAEKGFDLDSFVAEQVLEFCGQIVASEVFSLDALGKNVAFVHRDCAGVAVSHIHDETG